MIDMRLRALQRNFFDRPEVMRRLDAAKRKVLSKAGAFIRTRARTSIRPRKKGVSQPGSPPFSHTGKLRRGIYFAYDPGRESVVVGPVLFNAVASRTALPALEYGGPSVAVDTSYRGGRKLRTQRKIRVQARPFMAPAYEAERANINALWRDSVR